MPGVPVSWAAGLFLLRPYSTGDLAAFMAAVGESPETLRRWTSWSQSGLSAGEVQAWFDACARGWESGSHYTFAIFDTGSGAFVGECTLNHLSPRATFCNLGYWVCQSREGQGAASSAVPVVARFGFEQLGLNRIEIVVAVGNEASARVARKSGAVEEGVLRNRVVIDGQPARAYMFSLIPG